MQEILIIKNSSPFSYAHIHTFLTCAAVCSCGEDREPSEKSPATKEKAAWKWSMHRQIGRCGIVWRSVAAETQYKPVAPSCAVVLDAINAIQEEEKTNLAHIFIKYPFFMFQFNSSKKLSEGVQRYVCQKDFLCCTF